VKNGYAEDPVWVVQDSKELIWGAAAKPRSVFLYLCFSCDHIPEYRWSGEDYEFGIRFPGDRTCMSTGATIHSAPEASASVLARDIHGVEQAIEVLELGKKTPHNSRWHKVRLMKVNRSSDGSVQLTPFAPEVIGFMDSEGFYNGVGCFLE
jgi:hypothetical protein